MLVYNKEIMAEIFCDATEKLCIHSAVNDLNKDLSKVAGKTAQVKKYLPVEESGIVLVGTLSNPEFSRFLSERNIDVSITSDQWEYYHMRTFGDNNENLLICGSDDRGTMWGIYDFCKNELGVDPLYYWTDNEPLQKEMLLIEHVDRVDGPKTYKFRGWFINDEDYLTGWKSGGGKRYAKYNHYHQVVHADIIENVIETALRLKQNLMIPASLLNIDNPAEENLVRMVTERGMYVTQHHIEPLGVSHFSWENFWEARNVQVETSFVTQKERYIEIWTHYAKKWSKYENVIWQLGLRGRGDRPVWYHDSSVPPTMEDRGKLISSAIATQFEIVKKVLGHSDFLSTTTLWMEGAQLHRQGYLNFPDSTAIVFCDHGCAQMWEEDFYTTPRDRENSI